MRSKIAKPESGFRARRKRLGLTQLDVSILAKVGEETITKLETGRYVADETRLRIVAALDAYEAEGKGNSNADED